jgi:hypothetical protein
MKVYVHTDCDNVRPESRSIPVYNSVVEVDDEVGQEMVEYDAYDELEDVNYSKLRQSISGFNLEDVDGNSKKEEIVEALKELDL